ncbi:hypothetical protein QQP08_002743 [Theobroma cacao]|nr:hypothetical protein QQP08_002743 [Theobroma cacao]
MSMNMEVFYAKKQAEASGHKPAKKDEYERSEAENRSLKEKMEVLQSKMETKARANKLETDLSDQSKIMNVVKMANEALKLGMQQLHQDFLDQDVQAVRLARRD